MRCSSGGGGVGRGRVGERRNAGDAQVGGSSGKKGVEVEEEGEEAETSRTKVEDALALRSWLRPSNARRGESARSICLCLVYLRQARVSSVEESLKKSLKGGGLQAATGVSSSEIRLACSQYSSSPLVAPPAVSESRSARSSTSTAPRLFLLKQRAVVVQLVRQ